MLRMPLSMAVLVAAIALGGCNLTADAPAPKVAAAAPGPAQPNWPPLPEGAPCTADLKRYQAVLDADVGTGNVNRSVYEKIQAELVPVAQACAAGREAEARSLILSSKARHGYRS